MILTPAWSFFLLGAAAGYQSGAQPSVRLSRPLFPDLAVLLTLSVILVTAYLLNQIFDRETDRANKKVFFLAQGLFTVKTLVIMALAYFLLASFLFHRVDGPHKPPLVFALLLSLMYSLPPFRFCSRPVLDLLANAVGFGGIAFVLGYTLYDPSLANAVVFSLPYVFLVGGTFLFTTIMDIEGDRTTGKLTTSVAIGERNSERVACVIILGGLLIALITRHTMAAILVSAASAVCVYALISRPPGAHAFFVQAATLVVIVGAIALWPIFAACIVPLVLLSRYYFARRFGIKYPGVRKDV